MMSVSYPTVEWVKDPVNLLSGLPNGRPIERRHLADCSHWFVENGGSRIGGEPWLATEQQMVQLQACVDCARRARAHGHPEAGTRTSWAGGLDRRFWWVSQGYNFEIAIAQQTLWSLPRKGRDLPDRRLLLEMEPGDVVVHYADRYVRAVSVVRRAWQAATRPDGYRMRPGDGDDGWLVEVEVYARDLSLRFDKLGKVIATGPPGPLDKNGTPRQIYVAELSESEADAVIKAAGDSYPGAAGPSSLLGLPADHFDEVDTDAVAFTRIRVEQGHLRRYLLAGRWSAECALCGQTLPESLLVAAHIVPRRLLDHAERLDFSSVAMLACVLGCDALFEWGYAIVDKDGKIAAGRPAGSVAVAAAVAQLAGRTCLAYDEHRAHRYAEHGSLHTK